MTRPAHEEWVLARIEAELRRADPRFVALFDRLGGNGRRGTGSPAAATWRRLLAALLLTMTALAVALGGGRVAGWQGRPGPVLARVEGRAVAVVQSKLRDWRQEIQAVVWGSPPHGPGRRAVR
jgi:Protein of unknown function (DUF3040)